MFLALQRVMEERSLNIITDNFHHGDQDILYISHEKRRSCSDSWVDRFLWGYLI